VIVQPIDLVRESISKGSSNIGSFAPARWIGMFFGPVYARWCVRQMVRDLIHQFGAPSGRTLEKRRL